MTPKVRDFYDTTTGKVHRTAFFINYLNYPKPKNCYSTSWYKSIVKNHHVGDYITFEEACLLAKAKGINGIHGLEFLLYTKRKTFLPTLPELETDKQVLEAAQILTNMRR